MKRGEIIWRMKDQMLALTSMGKKAVHVTEKGQLDQSIESFNVQVPPTEQADMIEAVPTIGHSALVMPSTQSVSTLPDFYDSMSPLLSDEEDAFINQIVNGNSNLPPISNVNDYSVTEAASSSASNFYTAPTFTTLQPVSADILNTPLA